MYDVIVVGARCAGSPTAMLLARAGHKVLLVDRASFPSDTLSTHFIQLPGMVRLREWGLLDRLMATGCPPITNGRLDIDGQAVDANFPIPEGIAGIVAPRRTILDKLLVDAAVEAGAEFREGVMVDSLIIEDGRVVGIKGHSDAEPVIEERARMVIGADGRNSIVARKAETEYLEHVPATGGGYYGYWSGVDVTSAELYVYDGAFTVAFPTHDGLTTVAWVVPPERFEELRKDPQENSLKFLDGIGGLGERLRGGKLEQFVGVPELANFVRRAWGPGWALVGDALYHKDPTPADGITDAYRGADFLARAVDDILSGRASEEEALNTFEQEFSRFALPMLEKTLAMVSYDRSPVERATSFLEMQQLHADEVEELGYSMPATLGA